MLQEGKVKLGFFVAIVLMFIAFGVFASDKHTTHVTNVEQNYSSQMYNGEGVALAIATAQHHFDWNTSRWQGSMGIGSFNGEAISMGVAKRFDKVLLNGSIGHMGSKTSYGFGINRRF